VDSDRGKGDEPPFGGLDYGCVGMSPAYSELFVPPIRNCPPGLSFCEGITCADVPKRGWKCKMKTHGQVME